MKDVRKEIGGIGDSNGAMAEEMIFNALDKSKTFGGIKFDDVDRNLRFKLKKIKLEAEFDVVMQNGDTIALIETKYKVKSKHITSILEKHLPSFKRLFPVFNDHKIIIGIGGMSFEKDVEEEAIEKGIGIIKIVGDKVEFFTDKIKYY